MTASLPHDDTSGPPDDGVLEAAHAKFRVRRNPGPPTPFNDIAVERVRITKPTLALLRDLLARARQESYGAEVIDRTGLDAGTVYPQLKRLEDDDTWMSRATPGRGPGRRRTFYSLTPEGRRAASHEVHMRDVESPTASTRKHSAVQARTEGPLIAHREPEDRRLPRLET
ncbi:PadR family transcriptional regulator [Streptomyces halstedii]|uniref:PadR family transcriptional regulator n=1 Tax=Streptomyces halstedii TaxID=1944 RepID=UPI003821951E